MKTFQAKAVEKLGKHTFCVQ